MVHKGVIATLYENPFLEPCEFSKNTNLFTYSAVWTIT